MIPLRQPLNQFIIRAPTMEFMRGVLRFKSLIEEELNVKDLVVLPPWCTLVIENSEDEE